MNAKNLSLSFILFGLLLFGSAAFSFMGKSLYSAVGLFLAGLGIFTFAHFLNRRHYWGFTALLGQLFVMAALLGWQVLSFFSNKTVGSGAKKVTETGFLVYSILFCITIVYLIISSRNAARIRQELC